MADLSITASGVLKSETAQFQYGTFGETIVAGEWLYLHTDGKLYKADCTTAAKAAVVGIALNGGSAGQPAQYLTANDVTINGMTTGKVYCISNTAGKIRPTADITPGDYVTIVGGAKSATLLAVQIHQLGVAAA